MRSDILSSLPRFAASRGTITLFTSTGLAILLAGCGAGGGDGPRAAESPEVPRNVRVVRVARSDLNEYLTISGPAAPIRGTDLAAEESGQVADIPHDKGSLVRMGDVILTLDRRLLEAEMRSAEANQDLSAYNEDRTRQLFDANSVSNIEMLDAETKLKQAEAGADAARIRFERAATRAPFDGIVTDRHVELGQFVVPGMPVARIVDPYVLKLEGAVSEREVRSVQGGKSATVVFAGLPDPVPGTVHWVGFEADPLTGKFGVEIRIDNHDLKLRPGVIGRARILKTAHRGVITVPRDAIVEGARGPTVFVVEGNIARQRRLVLGPDQGMMVIVTDGLQAGDQLIVRGHREIHDGSAVLVREEATNPDGSLADDPGVVTQTGTVPDAWRSQPELPGEGR